MRALALVMLLLLVLSCNRQQGAPTDWTFQDLAEHLTARSVGLKLVVEGGNNNDLQDVYFVAEDQPDDPKAASAAFNAGASGVVRCTRMQTTDEARRQAQVVGYGGFASGRFVFSSRDDDALRRIRRALP